MSGAVMVTDRSTRDILALRCDILARFWRMQKEGIEWARRRVGLGSVLWEGTAAGEKGLDSCLENLPCMLGKWWHKPCGSDLT